MIISKLQGGLGNQMFQYAYGRSLSLSNNKVLKLDVACLLDRSHNHFTHREYELGVFNFQGSIASPEEVNLFFGKRTKWVRVMDYIFSQQYEHFKEPQTGYFQKVINKNTHVYLDGFWQSEKYFALHKKIIRSEFSFKEEASGENLHYLNEIKNSNAVSIHVRRGDYLTMPSAFNHIEVCSLNYYQYAVDIIASKISNPVFYIFSDEPHWVEENLKLRFPSTLISHNRGKKSFEDLRLMSACKHNIIANSSFSWWGAWLNNNDQKVVIAPQKWFKDETLNGSELIPMEWIKI